jgi:hypothetical protein
MPQLNLGVCAGSTLSDEHAQTPTLWAEDRSFQATGGSAGTNSQAHAYGEILGFTRNDMSVLSCHPIK